MIQEHAKRPSFMQRIGNAANKAAEVIPQHFMQQEQQKAQQMKMQQENEMIKQLTGMDVAGIQDPKVRQRVVELALQGQQKEKEFGQKSQFDQRQAAQKSEDDFNKAQQLQTEKYKFLEEAESRKPQKINAQEAKIKKEEEEKKQTSDRAQNSFNTMVDILKKGNIGRGSSVKSFFGGEAAKDTGKFLSATAGLEAMLVDMVSRGTLSNTRFKYITETILPKPTDSDAEIEGKLSALAELLNLDPSMLTGNKTENKSEGGKQSLQDIFG